MFDIGFWELVVVAVVALVVLGPERLPESVKIASKFQSRIRHQWQSIKQDFEQSVNMSDIKQDIHNDDTVKTWKTDKYKLEKELAVLNKQLDEHDAYQARTPKNDLNT